LCLGPLNSFLMLHVPWIVTSMVSIFILNKSRTDWIAAWAWTSEFLSWTLYQDLWSLHPVNSCYWSLHGHNLFEHAIAITQSASKFLDRLWQWHLHHSQLRHDILQKPSELCAFLHGDEICQQHHLSSLVSLKKTRWHPYQQCLKEATLTYQYYGYDSPHTILNH